MRRNQPGRPSDGACQLGLLIGPGQWTRAVVVFLVAMIFATRMPAQEGDLLVRGGHLFDSQLGEFQPNPGIVIRDGRIDSLGGDVREELPLLELTDEHYVLPGLIDLHAHYNVRLLNRRREEFDVNPVLYLANGVTVTFSAGEYDPEGMRELRQEIERGDKIGPRLINSGPYFGRARPGWRRAPTEEEIHREVDFWVAQGVGGFKAKSIDRRSLAALIERAHFHGLTVTGHLESGFRDSVNPKDAITLGIDRVEHFLGGDALVDTRPAYVSLAELTPDHPEFREIVEIYVESGTVFDATITAFGYFGVRGEEFDYWYDERRFLTPYMRQQLELREPYEPTELYENVYRAKQRLILPFFEAGGTITLGTDHFSSGDFVSGFCAHRELDALVRAGIPPADAIRIGTINGARALGIDGDHGSIEVGKFGDLAIVEGNPLENIRHTRQMRFVVRGGVVHDSRALLRSVEGRLGPAAAAESDRW